MQQLGGEVGVVATWAISAFSRRSRFLKKKSGPIPRRRSQSREPAEQKIKINTLYELGLRVDRTEQLQQAGAKQPLRRNRGLAFLGIGLLNFLIKLQQSVVRQLTNARQRMLLGHPLLRATGQIPGARSAGSAARMLSPSRPIRSRRSTATERSGRGGSLAR